MNNTREKTKKINAFATDQQKETRRYLFAKPGIASAKTASQRRKQAG